MGRVKLFILMALGTLSWFPTAQAATFHEPMGIATDSVGNIYVTEPSEHRVRKISPSGIVTTLAGRAGVNGDADGTGTSARFYEPDGLATDKTGNVYVADEMNNTIRKITPDGVVTTLAGMAFVKGYADGRGSVARFFQPADVAIDSSGNVYVADRSNFTIRKINPAGMVTTLAGRAQDNSPPTDGVGDEARLSSPFGIAVDSTGNIYVTETFAHSIRKITPMGVVTTLAGKADEGPGGHVDGIGAEARFAGPSGIAADSGGNLYVADSLSNTIRKITPAGVVTTLAGTVGKKGFVDGSGAAARFNKPAGVAVDSAGNVYVADTGNNAIRKISTVGAVTTLTARVGTPEHDSGPEDTSGLKAADYIGKKIYRDSDEYNNSSGFVAVDKRPRIPKVPHDSTDIGKSLMVQLIYKHGHNIAVIAEPHMTGQIWDWMLIHDAIDIPRGQQFIGGDPECLADKYPLDTVFVTGKLEERTDPNGLSVAKAKSISKAWLLDYDAMRLKEIPTAGIRCELEEDRN